MSPEFFKKRKARDEKLKARQRAAGSHRDAVVGLLLALLLWVSALVLIYLVSTGPQTRLYAR